MEDPAISALTRAQRIALCMEQNSAMQGNAKLISATSESSDSSAQSAMASSNGFQGAQATTSLWIGSEATLQGEGDKKPEAWMWGGARHRGGVPSPTEVASIVMERALARLGSRKGPTRKGLMILDPSLGASLVSRLIRPAYGQALSQGRSFWKGMEGKQSVSAKLSLVDDPLMYGGLASRLYDGDGISARKMQVIEEGILRNSYIDCYYGSKLGTDPTTGGRSNLVVKPGERDLAGILADAEDAVYVTGWLGGNSDGATGDFSLGVRGHLVSDGRIGAPVGEMNITGNLLALFSRLVEVGRDPWPYSSILCPALVFDGVDFSGASTMPEEEYSP
jgi:PmbA protein